MSQRVKGQNPMTAAKKKTPNDATDFEKEQLRFFLMRDDATAILTEVNPSLAWLPMLAKMKLIKTDTHLAPWMEKNFSDADAVRDVAANIWLFGPETAEVLEYRLNQAKGLSPLLIQCWRLIIRHMRTAKRGVIPTDWFDTEPRIKSGDRSSELLEKISTILRPKLRLGKRSRWYDEDGRGPLERPADVMSIDFEIEEGVTAEEVLSIWPESEPPELDEKLLRNLTHELSAVAEDAIEVGVESNRGYGTSDTDVPSVADHSQNEYHKGFLSIVRVMADLWTRLARKNLQRALPFIDLWRTSPFRLVRRLALFAAADSAVPADKAADVLISLPQGELFLTNSSVEVYRLIRARWRDFLEEKQKRIEGRLAEGPPPDWFKEDSDKERMIARSRFDMLGELQRLGFKLSANSKAVLQEIRVRWPQWHLRPEEQAGFHIWSGGGARQIVGDPTELKNVPADQLISAAKKAADAAGFLEGDSWEALCQSDPEHALSGLEAQAKAGDWPGWAWRPFLWATQKPKDADDLDAARIARLLSGMPEKQLAEISYVASSWMNERANTLDEKLLWPLWDRIEVASPRETEEAEDE
jgi:hypothetical protein